MQGQKIPPTAAGRQKRNEAACVLIRSHLGQELLITPEMHLDSHSSLSFWARQHSKAARYPGSTLCATISSYLYPRDASHA